MERLSTFILLLSLAATLVLGAAAATTASDGVQFSITWHFKQWAEDQAGDPVWVYQPGEIAVVELNLTNECELTFEVRSVRLKAEWAPEEASTLSLPNPVRVSPGETVRLGKISLRIPRDLHPGAYYYEFEVETASPGGDGWQVESWTLEGYRNLLIVPSRVELDIDYDLEKEFLVRAGGEARFQVHLTNEGSKTAAIEYVRIYPGWPGEAYEGEFFTCLRPGEEPVLEPGQEIELTCRIPIPPDLPEGKYNSNLEVATRAEYLGGTYREYWVPDYYVDYQVLKPESFLEKYKEALGVLTATASAISVIIGVYKKWKEGGPKEREKGD